MTTRSTIQSALIPALIGAAVTLCITFVTGVITLGTDEKLSQRDIVYIDRELNGVKAKHEADRVIIANVPNIDARLKNVEAKVDNAIDRLAKSEGKLDIIIETIKDVKADIAAAVIFTPQDMASKE